MKTQFLIIGFFEMDVINEVSLSSEGLTTDETFGTWASEIIGEPFDNELDATQELNNLSDADFWESWAFVEIKKVFVKK